MNNERHKEWLAGLKEGDEVILENRYDRYINKVKRTTRTLIFVHTYTFTRSNGLERGSKGRHLLSLWQIIEPTPDRKEEVEQEALRKSLAYNVHDRCRYAKGVHELSTSQLQRIVAILDESDET